MPHETETKIEKNWQGTIIVIICTLLTMFYTLYIVAICRAFEIDTF